MTIAGGERRLAAHPRLLNPDRITAANVHHSAHDPVARAISAALLTEAETYLTTPTVAYELEGIRLLKVTRTALRRVGVLTTVFRQTGDQRFAERAIAELRAIAGFRNFNPAHFLDTAEMTAALAFGYDWLYEELDGPTRGILERAIVEKGLQPALAVHDGWVTGETNWTIVCHAGTLLGALAVWEQAPEIAQQVVERAVARLRPSLSVQYGPGQSYAEGTGYWAYASTYGVLAISALKSALGTDFALAESTGFQNASGAFIPLIAPSSRTANFGDAGANQLGFEPVLYWFASHHQDSSLAAFADQLFLAAPTECTNSRFLFLVPQLRAGPKEAAFDRWPLDWTGQGTRSYATHRASWNDPRSAFVAITGGSSSVSHSHLDIGSVIFEAAGERWLIDHGLQDYNTLEQRGVKLWDLSQASPRWNVFRLGERGHSTFTIDGRRPLIEATAQLKSGQLDAQNPFTIVDLTPLYKSQVDSAVRGVALVNRSALVIHDSIQPKLGCEQITTRFVTRAVVERQSPRSCRLQQGAQQLMLDLLSPEDAEMTVVKPDYDIGIDEVDPSVRIIEWRSPCSERAPIAVVVRAASRSSEPSKSEQFFTGVSPGNWTGAQ